ncbi:MAG: hypothetical protein ACK5XB_19230 [Rhodospirillales bacterium]|jgi:hypothetical protein
MNAADHDGHYVPPDMFASWLAQARCVKVEDDIGRPAEIWKTTTGKFVNVARVESLPNSIRSVSGKGERLCYPRVYCLGLVTYIVHELYGLTNLDVVPPVLELGERKLKFIEQTPQIQPAAPANFNLIRNDKADDSGKDEPAG